MARLTRSAQVLIDQVTALKKNAKVETVDEPDGLDVERTIRFDKRTSAWLAPLLEEIEDERIEEINLTDAGYLHVRFSSEPLADFRHPFPLEAAQTVAEG